MKQSEVNKKYRGKYIDISKIYDYSMREWIYTVNRAYRDIHENTTLGEDVGTDREYTR